MTLTNYLNEEIMANLETMKASIGSRKSNILLLLKSKGNIKKFWVNKQIYNSFNDSKMFNRNYYLKRYPSVKKSGMDPVLHYILFGFKEGKFPSFMYERIYDSFKDSDWFDEDYYLKKYPEVRNSGIEPLEHYIFFDYNDDKFPSLKFEKIYNSFKDSELFDYVYYLSKYPGIKKSGMDPVLHYIFFGIKEDKSPSFMFEKIYDSFKDSDWFDEDYYLRNNPEIKKLGIDPLIHFIFFGYNEGRTPSLKFKKSYDSFINSKWFNENYVLISYPGIEKSKIDPLLLFFGYNDTKLPDVKFDGDYYLNTYKDVRKSKVNPLVHYLFYGKNEGRIFKSNSDDYKFEQYSSRDIDNILFALDSEKINIILYVYNDFENTEKCVESIIENTNINYELVVIDDANTDRRINSLLNRLETINVVKVVRNSKKLGFIESVNLEINNSEGDILLIKSNITVTNRWLQKLAVTAYSDEKIGTVNPLSNSYKFLSDIIATTTGIKQLKPDAISFLIESVCEHLKPEIKHPDESCIYIKREAINDFGLFDKEINYLEQMKDFQQKITDSGWNNIIDDSTYVHQNIESSKDLMIYRELSPQFKGIEEAIKLRVKDLKLIIPKKRVLYVLHENAHGITAGTGQTTKFIVDKIDNEFESYILVSTGRELLLWKREENQTIMFKSWKVKSKWSALDFYSDEFKEIYFEVLIGLNIDIIHIQHLIRHTHDLPRVANSLGLPIIFSVHDFYYICPSINLLDHNNHYCAGICATKDMQCKYPIKIFGRLPVLTDIIDTWRNEGSVLIESCSTFTAPSKSTMDLYCSIYPELKNKNCKVIEHGRDFEKKLVKSEIPSENKPIKILFPGIIQNHKGADFIRELKEVDHQNRLEFHFMGIISDDLEEIGIYHGKYKNEEFCEIVNQIKPSFIGIFSICPETYCHVLTEAWSCGIPVLATKMGALEERIEKNGGGWLLDHKYPQKAYNEIMRIANSVDEYLNVSRRDP